MQEQAIHSMDLVNDRYVVTHEMKSTQTASIWQGIHLELGYPVVLKLLIEESQAALAKKKREVEALRVMNNPFAIHLIDHGWYKQGTDLRPCLVLEQLGGTTLRERISLSRRLNPLDGTSIILQTLIALEELHHHRLLHCDIKPENVVLMQHTAQCEVAKLVDFGASMQQAATPLDGQVFGSPYYVAPEVREGQWPTVQSDLFSVGVMLYEALSGHKPAYRPNEEIESIGNIVPICADLAKIVDKAVAIEPILRFESAAEFINALDGLDCLELAQFDLGEFSPERDVEEICTLQVMVGAEENDPQPTVVSSSDTPVALLSTNRPTIWFLSGDPAIDQPDVANAINALTVDYDVLVLNNTARELALADNLAQPWVMVFGDLHVLLQDRLLFELGRGVEVSRMLISTHENLELLQNTLNTIGLHAQLCLPKSASEIKNTCLQMVERTRKIRQRYDGLRLALRDTEDDIALLNTKLADSKPPETRIR